MKAFDHLMKEKLDEAKKELLASTGKGSVENENITVRMTDRIKSPSDTTLYAPAVRRVICDGKDESNMIEKISTFVESIRVSEKDKSEAGPSGTDRQAQATVTSTPQQHRDAVAYDNAKERAEQVILEAERYKAVLADPPGEVLRKGLELNQQQVMCHDLAPVDMGTGISDDDFFHLTCHVEPGLISKIENGEFVDLDKLVPKDKRKRIEDNRMEWVHADGNTFLAPVADRNSKINGFRRWEQAFRVYATIYCGAKPHRSKEIWQYVSIISTAASSFVWENVYDYDVTFRHLMAFNPNRSWAVTYNQMWNLCMREPLTNRNNTNFSQKFAGNSRPAGGGGGGNSAVASSNKNTGHKKRKYCWNFNSGITCPYGKKCRFIERCGFCDSEAHGSVACPKVEKKTAN